MSATVSTVALSTTPASKVNSSILFFNLLVNLLIIFYYRFDSKTNLRSTSVMKFARSDVNRLGLLILWILNTCKLVSVHVSCPPSTSSSTVKTTRRAKGSVSLKQKSEGLAKRKGRKLKDNINVDDCDDRGDTENHVYANKDTTTTHGDVTYTCSNLTLINLWLYWFGPMTESRLTFHLLMLQCACSLVAFGIRYGLSQMLY